MNNKDKTLINISRRLLLEHNLTEKQIASMLYISETTLRDLYNKNFGIPPRKYIRKVLLKKAHTHIRITDKKISEIAYSIGYINTSKFTEAFKQIYGMTPSNYRKKTRKI